MSGYTKLFQSIVTSTVWSEDDRTRITWITMLAMANQHGEVEASIPGLAKLATVPIKDVEKALEILSSPDPYSRTKDFDGRRIEEIDGGWMILNHRKYRDKANEDDRREQDRLRKQRVRKCPQVSAQCPGLSAPSAHTDTEADTEGEEKRVSALPSASRIAETPSWNEFKAYCEIHGGPVEWYARDKWLKAEESNWKDKGNWKAYVARCKTWWENDGRPMTPPKGLNAENPRNCI